MTDKQFVEIEALPWITKGGDIEIGVYFGKNVCEPCYANNVSLRDLVDQELNSYTIPTSGKLSEIHTKDVEELLKNLKATYKYAEKRAKEIGYK